MYDAITSRYLRTKSSNPDFMFPKLFNFSIAKFFVMLVELLQGSWRHEGIRQSESAFSYLYADIYDLSYYFPLLPFIWVNEVKVSSESEAQWRLTLFVHFPVERHSSKNVCLGKIFLGILLRATGSRDKVTSR